MAHLALGTGFLLILIGLYGSLANRNMMRMIVAFSVASTGLNLVFVAVGFMKGRAAPILDESVPVASAIARVMDPVPQALVLTAIVIGVGVTALMLAYCLKLYESKGSLDITKWRELKW